MIILLFVVLVLALIVIAIIRFDIHPFLALFVGAILYGLLVGMPTDLILKSIADGFGGVIGKIGIVILLGVIIGTFLEKTGGALVIAQKILSWIGEKSVMLAMMITGWILSIPIFGDSAFVIMNPINKSLSFKAKVPFAATTVALTMGLTATHSLVPPTPGPIATAGILGADLGLVIFWGAILSALALVPCFFFVKYYVTRFDLQPKMDEAATSSISRYPSSHAANCNSARTHRTRIDSQLPLASIRRRSACLYPDLPRCSGNCAFDWCILILQPSREI
jgi:GntP family gluconate:H+ symporter